MMVNPTFEGKVHKTAKSFYCKACKNSVNISQVDIPYATKLLFQELMAMAIVPRLKVKK